MHSLLSRAVDARDMYARGHSSRVTATAEAIARRLDWDEEQLELLQLGGPLHDVGKLAIPDEVLRKPGRLDDEEMAQIREHPRLGARILLRLSAFRDALPYVLYHHERWGRTGYPTGRAGEQIPGEARVLAVAEAHDAMTIHSPYGLYLTRDQARAEVERCSGS